MDEQFHLRRAGVLLHPTSLPSGTLADADAWLDFLDASGLRLWQMLPLGVPQDDLSPYQCLSAFATNPALLDQTEPPRPELDQFQAWRHSQAFWLRDYALFRVIKARQEQRAWFQWPDPLKWRHPEALAEVERQAADTLLALEWEQFLLQRRWQALKSKAAERHIALFGDLPLFVAHDSADVWACPRRFLLDEAGQPAWVAGVPPDYFSATGQRWGNPHYDWEYHRQEGFAWWLNRIEHHLQWFDLVRIDHFRGLQAVWMIPAEAKTAESGHWQRVPGDELLHQIQERLGRLPLVAEDLGIITPEVRALKEKYGLPGMAILQFAFDHFDDNPNKPQNIGPNTVVYTGTHDNDTTLGWYQSLPDDAKAHVRAVLGLEAGDDVVDAMIRTAFDTRANLAVIPLQDFLKLGSEARMNVPGVAKGNWRWRFHWEQLDRPGLSAHLRQLIRQSNREVAP